MITPLINDIDNKKFESVCETRILAVLHPSDEALPSKGSEHSQGSQRVSRSPKVGLPLSGNLGVPMSVGLPISGNLEVRMSRVKSRVK